MLSQKLTATAGERSTTVCCNTRLIGVSVLCLLRFAGGVSPDSKGRFTGVSVFCCLRFAGGVPADSKGRFWIGVSVLCRFLFAGGLLPDSFKGVCCWPSKQDTLTCVTQPLKFASFSSGLSHHASTASLTCS